MGHDVYVIGNIAAGKSTLARLLAARIPRAVYVPEPVERNPFLPDYLRDQARWGMACMTRYFLDYLEEWQKATGGGGYAYHFVDAGTPTNRRLYGRYLQGERIITSEEYRLYSEVCDLAQRAYNAPAPHAFVYAWTDPMVCWQRMRARGWEFQVAAVDSEYVGKLHVYVEEMAAAIAAEGFPLLVLPATQLDFCAPTGQAEAVRQVRRFLEGLP